MKLLWVEEAEALTEAGAGVVNRRWTSPWRGDVALLEEGRGVVARGRLDSIHEGAGAFCCSGGDPRPGMFHLYLTDVVPLREPVPMRKQLGMPDLDPSDEREVRSS